MQMLLPPPVSRALTLLNRSGFSAYAVGGCVRDTVLGVTPHDYDICTSALPQEMQQVFRNERTIQTGLQHGTLTVLMDNMPLEITTFRVDGEYKDGRHPESVLFTRRVEEDLSRRDFTINAMAYAPEEGLIDPFSGEKDCKMGIIRCVGEPERRFDEDALRILRALRFSARLGFPIEESTAKTIHQQKDHLHLISAERIAAELTGILMGKHAGHVLDAFSDVIFSVLPMLAPMMGCPQQCVYHDKDVWKHTLCAVDSAPQEPLLRWAVFLHDCEKPSCHTRDRKDADHFYGHPEKSAETAEKILRGLKMPRLFIQQARQLILWHDIDLEEEKVQWVMMHLGAEQTERLLKLRQADQAAHAPWIGDQAAAVYRNLHHKLHSLLQENACFTLSQLAVNGKDLSALGITGPKVGETLQSLLEKVVRNQVKNEKDALLKLIQ